MQLASLSYENRVSPFPRYICLGENRYTIQSSNKIPLLTYGHANWKRQFFQENNRVLFAGSANACKLYTNHNNYYYFILFLHSFLIIYFFILCFAHNLHRFFAVCFLSLKRFQKWHFQQISGPIHLVSLQYTRTRNPTRCFFSPLHSDCNLIIFLKCMFIECDVTAFEEKKQQNNIPLYCDFGVDYRHAGVCWKFCCGTIYMILIFYAYFKMVIDMH